jgi:acetyl esterase/lipase
LAPWLLVLLLGGLLVAPAPSAQGRTTRAERAAARAERAAARKAVRANRALIKDYLIAPAAERPAIAQALGERQSAHEVRQTLEDWRDRYRRRRAGVHARSIKIDGERARYTVVAPRGYNPKKAWPLHIALHGGGSYGRNARGVKRYWDERRCLQSTAWGRRPQRGFILVCPTTPMGYWWKPEGDAVIMAVYQDVIRAWNVDTARVSVGGLSNGGTGTWHITMKYPWIWSAAVPRCAAEIHDDAYVRNIESMPVYMIHGSADHLIPVESSRNMSERLQRWGNEAHYTEIVGGGHRFFPGENRRVVPWMLAQKRETPERFTYTTLDGNPAGLVYWVHAPGSDRLEAAISREGAEVKVTLQGERLPTATRVFLPDAFAESGANLRVFVGGGLVHEGPIKTSVEAVLESFRLTGDPARTFLAAVTLDLPEPPPRAEPEPAATGESDDPDQEPTPGPPRSGSRVPGR